MAPGLMAALPAGVICNDILLFLDAPSRVSMSQVRSKIFEQAQPKHLGKSILEKMQQIKGALDPLTHTATFYPGIDSEEFLDFELTGVTAMNILPTVATTRTLSHILRQWGLEGTDATTEIDVLQHIHPDLAGFRCPFCAWVLINDHIPEVQTAVEVLLTMDTTFHYFSTNEVFIIKFSDPITGIVGSCAVRVGDSSDDESSSSD